MGRVVGVEIDDRSVMGVEHHRQFVAVYPVGRVADGGEQLGRRSVGRPRVERIVEGDRDRVDIQGEPGRQGGGVVAGRVAGDGVVAVREIDEIEDRRCGRGALVGDDLVAGGVEAEAGQRDDRAGRGSRPAPCR